MINASPRLQARDLRYAIGDSISVDGVNFRLARGSALLVDGPSGAGKSTLLRVLCRLLAADAGELLLDDVSSSQVPPGRWRQQVAYLAQTPVMLPATVRDNLAAPFATKRSTAAFDESRARGLLASVGLESEMLDREATTLSGGEASRVALCRAMLLQPTVVLADEPTAALDDHHADAVVRLVSSWVSDGGALLLVAHDAARWATIKSDCLQLPPRGAVS